MKCVIAPDSFKESLTAVEVACAIQDGIKDVFPDATCIKVPMCDGGEGFVGTMAYALDACLYDIKLPDALGRERTGYVAYDSHTDTAVIECAQSIGLEHIEPSARQIMHSDSRGVGHMIRWALDRGASSIIIGLGGSATNDYGAGMLSELGVLFLDKNDNVCKTSPEGLSQVAYIDTSGLDARLRDVDIKVACDVKNPVLGSQGAAYIFAPQKGADNECVIELEKIGRHVLSLCNNVGENLPGGGAAGGLGWALTSIVGAQLVSGSELVAQTVNLEEKIRHADLVITGEGSLDSQSIQGKAPSIVAHYAHKYNVACIACAGKVDSCDQTINSCFSAVIPVVRKVCTYEEALENAYTNVVDSVGMVMRIVNIGLRITKS